MTARMVRRWGPLGIVWPDVARLLDWEQLAHEYRERAATDGYWRHHAELIADIVDSGVSDRLGAYTSMHDLHVLNLATGGPLYEGLAVQFRAGMVSVRHISFTGLDDEIHRPASVAVALFWRFADVKFDLRPAKRADAVRAPSGCAT